MHASLNTLGAVLPAYAGMVLRFTKAVRAGCGLPCVRGDGPPKLAGTLVHKASSLRTRGWSQLMPVRVSGDDVFPAYAGMVRCPRRSPRWSGCLPCVRGDGPLLQGAKDRPCVSSLRTRGWSVVRSFAPPEDRVFPAYAGMVPAPEPRYKACPRLPCVRGDGPDPRAARRVAGASSLRTRGWSQCEGAHAQQEQVFPAYAGMVYSPPRLGSGCRRSSLSSRRAHRKRRTSSAIPSVLDWPME